MGRATIVSEIGEGRYLIDVDLGQAQKAARYAALTASISALDAKIVAAQAAADAAQVQMNTDRAALSAAVEAYVVATQEGDKPEDWADELAAHEQALITATKSAGAYGLARSKLQALQLDRVGLEKQRSAVSAITTSLQRFVWCADLTEEATGQVGTIEIPGESNRILIKPGAPSPANEDGRLVARGIQSPEQVYWNAAALPGWQAFRPTYRTGTIVAIDSEADTADVLLDDATSSAQDLPINATSELAGVPIEYMTCNSAAFEEGDACVVRFDGSLWGSPKVIGFVTDPKSCALITLNGEFDAWTDRGYFKGLVTPARAREIVENRGSMSIMMNGTPLGIYDFSLADPMNIWCEWAFVFGGSPGYYVRFSSGAVMSPCGKAEFLCYNDIGPGAWTLQINKGAQELVNVAYSCSEIGTSGPSPPFGYLVCNGTPARPGNTAVFVGTGVKKQADQDWITVNPPPP